MAYVPSDLHLVAGKLNGTDTRTWEYKTTDAMNPTVRAAGYIADGFIRGMRVGDIVQVLTVNGSNVVQTNVLATVISFTSGAADLSDGTALTVTNS